MRTSEGVSWIVAEEEATQVFANAKLTMVVRVAMVAENR
jgi:hypothetical protein